MQYLVYFIFHWYQVIYENMFFIIFKSVSNKEQFGM